MALHPGIFVAFSESVSVANIKATMVCKIASRTLKDVFRIASVTMVSAHFRSFHRLIVDTIVRRLFAQVGRSCRPIFAPSVKM
jgi:hypothetical protein